MLDDREFREILGKLNRSFEGYRRVRKGVKKRLRRHIQACQCKTVSDYLKLLEEDRDVRRQCEELLLVTISRFFRDRPLWDRLETRLLSTLLSAHQDPFSVWSAGCSCGEEAYSFRILWHRMKKPSDRLPRLYLLGTDANSASLERAKEGEYPASSLREVSQAVRKACFQSRKGGKRFRLLSEIKAGVTWRQHQLLDAPPGKKFQIIFLRNNLLTYYVDSLRIPALKAILTTLTPNGLLVIGAKEALPGDTPDLVPDKAIPYLFRKKTH